jgi:hypothetical protein
MSLKSKEFKALQSKWYRKLEKEGFEDVEDGEKYLKQYHSHYFQDHYKVNGFTSKQRYFQLASHFLHDHQFPSKTDRKIWEMHSEGATLIEIQQVTKISKITLAKKIHYYASFIKC